MYITYHRRVHECCPVISSFKHSENKGYGGRSEENEDELILKLFENEFP